MASSPPAARIIGLTGRAGAGKDTAFRLLSAATPGIRFQRKAFADLLKESAMLAIGLDPKDADEFKTRGRITVWYGADQAHELTGREYFQRYGMEAHREVFGEDFWMKHVLHPDVLDENAVTVITDVRLDNEAEQIKALGGEVWLIGRDGATISESGHKSEAGVSEELIDRSIHNTGSLIELEVMMSEAFGAVACRL
jgi:hypothetical protein